jgi:hypothetical protein
MAVGELDPGTMSDYGSLYEIDCPPSLHFVRINPPRAPPKEISPYTVCSVLRCPRVLSFRASETLIGSRLADSIPQELEGSSNDTDRRDLPIKDVPSFHIVIPSPTQARFCILIGGIESYLIIPDWGWNCILEIVILSWAVAMRCPRSPTSSVCI